MITERMTGIAQHTANVLDEIVDTLRKNREADTAVYVAIKEEIGKARTKGKNLSGEHRVEG